VWNTSTYPPGTYTVSVESKLNNMQFNYLSGSSPYYGRTVSQPTTITLVGGNPSTSTATKIGIYKDGIWYLDVNGNGVWDGAPSDTLVTAFGMPGWTPLVGDWNGDTKTEIGIYKDGTWYLDMNGNGAWNGDPPDKLVTYFGMPGWTPVIGKWS